MHLLKNYLIATNDNVLQDDPTHKVVPYAHEYETKTQDWYIARRITMLFGYFDQRGALAAREPTNKPQGKSTRVSIDDALDKKFRSLLGL